MPDDFAAWRSHSRAVLSLSANLATLSEDEKLEIIYYDNGNWLLEDIYHWCVIGCRCVGNREMAFAKVLVAIRLSVGPKLPVGP